MLETAADDYLFKYIFQSVIKYNTDILSLKWILYNAEQSELICSVTCVDILRTLKKLFSFEAFFIHSGWNLARKMSTESTDRLRISWKSAQWKFA
jgi:hypothetical protein